MSGPNPTATQLAAAFIDALHEELGAELVAEVVERNRADDDPLVCHSHDFCDANMTMEAAWIDLGVTEDGPDAEDEQQTALWSRAWDLAKRAEFNSDNLLAP